MNITPETDVVNTIKSLEAQVARLQKEHSEIYRMLYARGIRCKVSVASGLRRYFKRMEKARKLLK